MRRRGSIPSVLTIETICKAFGITLSQFFSVDHGSDDINDEKAALLDRWARLNEKQKDIVMEIIDEFKTAKNT